MEPHHRVMDNKDLLHKERTDNLGDINILPLNNKVFK
jgi:hypothetical protein